MAANNEYISRTYQAETLINFSVNVLRQLDVPGEHALEVSKCLVEANLRGVDSHGIVRLPVYARRILAGVVNPTAEPKIESLTGAVCLIDGDNGLGPVAGGFAVNNAIKLAKQYGIAIAGVKHSNHFGAASYYVHKVVDKECIGIAISNAPANMAPWGGKERFLGTNPLAIGVPAKNGKPVIIDMATSVVARGKIILAAQKGESIPEGWAIDIDGNPTTDAQKALEGSVLPFGGPKGSAISLVIDILAAVITGAAYGNHINTLEDINNVQNLGHSFLIIDINKFMSKSLFYERLNDLLNQLTAVPTAPQFNSVLVPGTPEQDTKEIRKEKGIVLTPDVIKQLEHFGQKINVPFEY